MNETNISYIGEVTLKLKIGDRIVRTVTHNVGWSPLFKFISLALSGNLSTDTLNALRPTFIDVRYASGLSWVSCLYAPLPITPSFYSMPGNDMSEVGGLNYLSIFSCTISYSMLNMSIVQSLSDSADVRLFLLSGEALSSPSDDTNMVTLMVDADSVKSIQPGSQVIVEWTMKFCNQTNQQESSGPAVM